MPHYDSTAPYPRDLIGYGRSTPHPQWPGQARVAVQFVLNYEEGGENSVLHGDAGSEQFLSEMFNPAAFPDRHISMEGIYEYGSRAGVWRILREFEKRKLPLTVFGVSTAMQKHPELCAAFQELGHDIACHGLKWIHYQNIDEATEREHMAQAMQIMQQLQGQNAPMDPAQAMMAETQRKAQADQINAQLEQAKLQLQAQQAKVKQLENARRQEDNMRRELLKQDRLDQRQIAELDVKLVTNREDNKTAKDIAAMEAVSGEKVGVSTGTGINP